MLPIQEIHKLVDGGALTASETFTDLQFQPASVDLRLGSHAYRIQASFLPGGRSSVAQRLEDLTLFKLSLEDGAVLERGCVYVVPLLEELDLPANINAIASPKSSTGRLDILSRLITENGTAFDTVPAGYTGKLYLEIAPVSFSVLVRTGDALNQIRFRSTSGGLESAPPQTENVVLSVDLKGSGDGPVGYCAKSHCPLIDLRKIGHYRVSDFWDELAVAEGGSLILNPGDFYILSSAESVAVPPGRAAEMVPFDHTVGEFRVHYAGFFDPGFGWPAEDNASKAVLEVRSRDVPFLIEHGQPVAILRFENLSAPVNQVYGGVAGSNYQRQGLRLGKQFRV